MEQYFKDKVISFNVCSSVKLRYENIDHCIRYYHPDLECCKIESSTEFNIEFSADKNIFLLELLFPSQFNKEVKLLIYI